VYYWPSQLSSNYTTRGKCAAWLLEKYSGVISTEIVSKGYLKIVRADIRKKCYGFLISLPLKGHVITRYKVREEQNIIMWGFTGPLIKFGIAFSAVRKSPLCVLL
jgi:hypothetical protein